MKALVRLFFSLLAASALATPALAAEASESGDPNAVRHSADGYYLDFAPAGILELPRLLLVRTPDGGLGFDAFANTHSALESDRYTLGDGRGGVLSPEQVAATFDEPHEHDYLYFPLQPLNGEVIIDFSISRQLVFVFVSAMLLLIIGLRMAARYRKDPESRSAPRGVWQNMMEVFVVFVRDEIGRPTLGEKTEKYLPFLLTAFFFILIANLLGLVPWGVTATSGIAITGALAVFTFVITQLAGTKDYWAHIFNPPGIPLFVKVILVPVEILGMFTKPIALAFRLFGNMLSGHLVIVSLIGLIFIFSAQFGTAVGVTTIPVSVALTIFIYILKIAVSFIQAYVFTMLSAVFIGLALEEHGHAEHDPDHGEIPEPHLATSPPRMDAPLAGNGLADGQALTRPAVAG